MDTKFSRVELLLGKEALDQIGEKKVILFGVGGVGGWCAECLIRSGVHHLTIVDFDKVMPSNINRQLPANHETIGRHKVEVLQEHFKRINPEADVVAIQERYSAETAHLFNLDDYDYVIDAIDSVADKALLILNACESRAKLFSSMGAALKMDPTRIKTASFDKVQGDALAKALRQRFKKDRFPSRRFTCVYSEERLKNQIEDRANGSMMHVTATFGLTLAGLVIKEASTN